MAKRKQVGRTSHPGVKLIKRKRGGIENWVGRWTDPDTNRVVEVTLKKLGKTNAESRRTWAINKYKSLLIRNADISLGKPKITKTKFREAVDLHYAAKQPVLKPKSMAAIRYVLEPLVEWAAKNNIKFIERMTPAQLSLFHTASLHRKVTVALIGSKRGKKKAGSGYRSARTINKQFVLTRSFLNEARRIGLTPLLSGDDVEAILKLQKTKRPEINFLRQHEIKLLLQAALRHDSDCWVLTREERDGKKGAGATRKHLPITPFIIACLLTGCRFSEIAELQWSEVELEHGYIYLPPERVKTGIGRRIGFDESPMLKKLLSHLSLMSDGSKFVFGRLAKDSKGKMQDYPMRRDLAESTRKRLFSTGEFGYSAPKFTWQDLRKTCGTFITCSPSIFGGASAFLSAKRLGHSVAVAESNYVGLLTGIPPEAKTIESAMEITGVITDVPSLLLAG